MGRSSCGPPLQLATVLLFLLFLRPPLLPAHCKLLKANESVEHLFPPFFSNATAGVLDPTLACSPDSYWAIDNVNASDICQVWPRGAGNGQQDTAVGLSYPARLLVDHNNFATRFTLAGLQVRFYDPHTGPGYETSFNTTFVFCINISRESNFTGDGLAFIIVPNVTVSSDDHAGDFIYALFQAHSETGAYALGDTHTFSVEIDTVKDQYDVQPVPHVGVNLNDSLASANSSYLWNMSDFLNREIAVWIDYSAGQQLLRVWMMNATDAPGLQLRKENALLVLSYANLNLSSQVLQDSYVGFGAFLPEAPSALIFYNWTFDAVMDTPRPPAPAPAPTPVAALIRGCVGAVVLLVLVLVLAIWGVRRKRWRRGLRGALMVSFADHLDGPKEFSYSQLKKATKNFSEDNLIGAGGFGKVYKGVLEDGQGNKTPVAVKRVHRVNGGEKEFISELTTIGCLRHKNVVPLRGWCHHSQQQHGQLQGASEGGCLLLVYEYMPNGSLEQHLQRSRSSGDSEAATADHDTRQQQQQQQQQVLSWEQRYSILQDIAAALVYLHGDGQEARVVVHRDVKPSNVLLDEGFAARLGDFGLARLVCKDAHSKTVSDVAGTLGYLAPETVITGKVSAESDVYSFGVVALEVVCGRKAIEWWRPQPEDRILVTWVLGLAKAGRLMDAADPALELLQQQHTVVMGVLRLGLLCCIGQPEDRPTMRLVSRYLTAPAALAVPKLPDLSKAYFQQVYYPGSHSLQDVQDLPHRRTSSSGATSPAPHTSHY